MHPCFSATSSVVLLQHQLNMMKLFQVSALRHALSWCQMRTCLSSVKSLVTQTKCGCHTGVMTQSAVISTAADRMHFTARAPKQVFDLRQLQYNQVTICSTIAFIILLRLHKLFINVFAELF